MAGASREGKAPSIEETQDHDTEEDWGAPPGYFEFLRNPSEEVANASEKAWDNEIKRFGAPLMPDAGERLDAMFAIAKEKMLKEEEEALAGWTEDNIELSMIYLPHKSSDPSKEKCLVKWDHPVVAYLNATAWSTALYSKYNCVKGTDCVKAYATDVRACLTKIKARLRARDA